MDRSEVITLVAVTRTQNDFGVWEEHETRRNVFCQVDSVSRSEFFEGGRNGLNPEYRFKLFFGDYNGETVVIFKGSAYSVYRTYQPRTDTVELYVERKGGTNGKANSGS
jgi:hypothetical protein